MARKARRVQDAPSDDDGAPEVVSHSASKAYAKRSQKALRNFEAEEKARKKARNREKDQKLKERASATKGGKMGEKLRGIQFDVDQGGEDEGESSDGGDDVVARMLRAMKDAENEVESDEEDDEFRELGRGTNLDDGMASGSESSLVQDEDDEDDEISLGGNESMDPEVSTDEQGMDDDEGTTLLQASATHKPSRKSNYLADDLFAAAFASQNTKSVPEKKSESDQRQTVKKRRRRFSAHSKDLVIGGRTIRTLPRPSDPRSQATARSVPSARARRFVDQNLAMKGKQALAKAKKKGWERRPANVGVMKHQGAPHGFARSTR